MADTAATPTLLTTETVAAYAAERLGLEASIVGTADEIMGGNLNYAWRVTFSGPDTSDARVFSVFVKQAPEFIKCLGKDFGLTSLRMHREVAALQALGAVSSQHVPGVMSFDAPRRVVILEDMKGYALLRDELLTGNIDATVAGDLGRFLATVRRSTANGKVDVGGDNNAAMRAVTRDYVFTKPFVESDPTNRTFFDDANPDVALFYKPVAAKAAAFRNDANLIRDVEAARKMFDGTEQCLCHGDLHAGSVMTNGIRTVAIDAEFAFVGPSAFDFALLVAGYCFAYCASKAWASTEDEAGLRRRKSKLAIQNLLLHCAEDVPAVAAFAACELARRVLGAASVPDLSSIKRVNDRAEAEGLVLDLAALLLRRKPDTSTAVLLALDDTFDASVFASGSN